MSLAAGPEHKKHGNDVTHTLLSPSVTPQQHLCVQSCRPNEEVSIPSRFSNELQREKEKEEKNNNKISNFLVTCDIRAAGWWHPPPHTSLHLQLMLRELFWWILDWRSLWTWGQLPSLAWRRSCSSSVQSSITGLMKNDVKHKAVSSNWSINHVKQGAVNTASHLQVKNLRF